MHNTTKTAKKTTTLLAGAALSLGLLGGMAAPSMAAEAPAPQAQQASQADVAKVQGNIKKVDDSNMAFRLSDGDKLAQDGSAVVGKDGTKQALPSQAKDKNGKSVALKYAEKDGVVTINVVQSNPKTGTTNKPMASAAMGGGWKCALGTGGGAGTGAIAGGAAGATIGSVVPGAGTAAGWAIGTAIGGAVSGGAVGAAASC